MRNSLKLALVLWLLALLGVALVLPYVLTIESNALTAASKAKHLPVNILLALSLAQSAVLLGVAILAGLWAGRKLGLGAPLLSAWLSKTPPPPRVIATLALALVVGAVAGAVLVALDLYVFQQSPSVQALMHAAAANGGLPPWMGFLASFYGALDEEILMRLGLLSLLALLFRTVSRWMGVDRTVPLPDGVFWSANVVSAALFGLGHLPATAALAPLTPMLITRAIVENGLGGLAFGVLYRRFELEWAMASHFGCDIVLHVLAA